MDMARQVDTLGDQEQHSHAEAAEYLEVDPKLMKGEGDEQVGATAENKEDDPGQVESGPDLLRQVYGVAHNALDKHLVTNEVTGCETQSEQPVDHGCLPLEEGFTVEGQRHATEQQAGDQGQPLAFFQLAVECKQGAVHQHRTDDQHGCRTEDASQLHALTGNIKGAGIELVDDEEQDQRDEVYELFHGGSQKRDVAA